MSRQFKQAVAWWLRAKDLSVKEVLDLKVKDSRGWSELTGEWGSEDIVVTYIDERGKEQRHTEELDFASFVSVLADTDWEGATAELDAEKAEKERLDLELRAEHEQFQRELQVALFDGDTQVSGWVSFAEGKIPVPNEWAKQRKFSANTGPRLQLRTKDGAGMTAAGAHVQEHITKTYSITWRTVW